MLRDRQDILGQPDLSVDIDHTVKVLLQFVDSVISGFPNYYFAVPGLSRDENAITYHIINYFNSHLDETSDGFSPYRFIKNPPQPDSRKETDLGVVISNKNTPVFPIIEFEAKRLSNMSNNSEYVYGERGGIERFKRDQHGRRLKTCGMLGYIQNGISADWIRKINDWISEQAGHKRNDLDWSHVDEKLIHTASFDAVEKWQSTHKRNTKSKLLIHHYFIDLCVRKK